MLTSLNQLAPGQPWPPSEEDRARLKRYEQNRLLFEGDHARVFESWIKLLRKDQQATLEIVLNWYKRLSTLWADLLLGEPPKFSSGEYGSDEQKQLSVLIERNNFINTLYEIAIDLSRYGSGIFKIRLDDKAVIEAVPPTIWFPVVNPGNIKDIQAHVIAYVFDVPAPTVFNKDKKEQYLKVETHEKGLIRHKLFRFSNGLIGEQIPLNRFFPDLPEEENTGVEDFLVIPVQNLVASDRIYGLDDYSDLDSIIQELEVRIAQISRILDKHADPNMYGPDSALEQDPETGEWVFRGGGKYFPVSQGEEPPGYVTWNGELEAAFKEIDLLMEQLYILSETSAAAFGQIKSGLAESGSALRRLMMAPLAKVNRIRMRLDPAVKKVLKLASELEAAAGTGISLENINIQWQDGLPDDDKEVAEVYEIYLKNGVMSRETAIQKLFDLDPESLKSELERISREG